MRGVSKWLNCLVGLGRVELPTSPLSGVRSSHLSYRPKKTICGFAEPLRPRFFKYRQARDSAQDKMNRPRSVDKELLTAGGPQASTGAANKHALPGPYSGGGPCVDFSPVGCTIPVSSRHAQTT